MKRILFLFILSLLAASCGNDAGNASPAMYDEATYPNGAVSMEIDMEMAESFDAEMSQVASRSAGTNSEPVPAAPVEKKKIIKEGRMGVEVKDIGEFKARADVLVIKYNGYYGQENYNDGDYQTSYSLTIRIPSADYEKFVDEVGSGGGKILYKQINANDVTEAFVDMESRLKTKRHSLERYRELVRRANTIKEVMDVEYEIRRIEEEIESVEGRLRLLGDRVSFSTLELTLIREKDYMFTPGKRDSFGERLKESLSEGWDGLVYFLIGLIRVWPVWIILAIMVYLLRRAYLSAKRKERNKAQNGD